MNSKGRTVRDLNNQILHEAQVRGMDNFPRPLPKHMEFWEKINRLGWTRRTKQPEECDDVAATAFLTEEEYQTLLEEFRRL
jgi:hypothetical protein